MTDRKGQQENTEREDNINRDERWLEKICERCVMIDTTEIKKRIRVEMNEQWLSGELNDDESPEVASRIQGRLRRHITQQKNNTTMFDRNPRKTLVSSLIIAGSISGIAAMIALSWVGFGESVSVENEEYFDTLYADTFEQFSYDEFDKSLNDLSDELDQYLARRTSLSQKEYLSDDWITPTGIDTSDG